MAKYKAKVLNIIEAEQFNPPLQIPKGVMNVHQMSDKSYRGQVYTIQGVPVEVKSGEWIVKEPNNDDRYYPIANEVFIEKYDLYLGDCSCGNNAKPMHHCAKDEYELCNCCDKCESECANEA